MIKKTIIWLIITTVIFSAVSFFGGFLYNQYKQIKRQQFILEKRKLAWKQLEKEVYKEASKFRGEVGILIKDLETGWEVSYNKDSLFPAASLVKIPIMAACFSAVNSKKISLADKLVLKGNNKVLGSGILKSMPSGSVYTVEQLIKIMVTRSDNTASNMLIDLLGFDYLNKYFKREGLVDTNLSRKMMDFKDRRKGVENYTSVRDISYFLERMYYNDFISPEVSAKCINFLKGQKVNDRIPKKLPDNTVVAHKTGLERYVCHDAGIVYTQNGDFLICVLTKSKVCIRSVKDFIAKMALYTYNKYNRNNY